MAYKNQEELVKILNGVKAPAGFHYMPNGKLMKDADHVAMFGYIDKYITRINGNLKDINHAGEKRVFSVSGNSGSIFSVFVQDSDGKFYDFTSESFVSRKTGLNRIEIEGRDYSFEILFPTIGVSLKSYTINIVAETGGNVKTSHTALSEFRNEDNSININKSSGSNSTLLQKILYQDVAKNFYLSCVAPSKYATSASQTDGAVSSSNRVVIDDDVNNSNIIDIYDLVSGTGVDTHQLVTVINPDNDNTKEFQLTFADSIGDDVALTFTPPFNGMTPHYTDSTTGRYSQELSSGSSLKSGFTITATAATGRTFEKARNPNINDLCAITTVTFGSSALAIKGEDTSSSTYYRWPITNIANLKNSLLLDPARSGTGANTSTPASISNYETTSTIYNLIEEKYNTDIEESSLSDVYINGVDAVGNDVTAVDRNGRVTAQAGNITFDTQQADALKSDSNVRLFGYGEDNINNLTGMSVKLTNTNVTLTQISTTTSSGVSNSTTIPVAEAGNISVGMTMRGIGVSASAVNPTVVSKNVTSGAGNVVVSAAQTIENGQTLFFDGASNIATITGTIELSNMPISDTTLYLDVERFLIAK